MTRLVVDAAAERDLRAASTFYDGQASGLGLDFLAEVARAFERIAAVPDAGSPFGSGHRRYLLQRFPYSVIYRPDRRGIVIVAVMHHRRRPDAWER